MPKTNSEQMQEQLGLPEYKKGFVEIDTARGRVRVAIEEWKGSLRLDIRTLFNPEGSKEWFPTKSGVVIPEENIEAFVAALFQIGVLHVTDVPSE